MPGALRTGAFSPLTIPINPLAASSLPLIPLKRRACFSDAVFGVMAGAMTPGDIGDKFIAGTTQAIGGGLGGLGLSAAATRAGIHGTPNFLLDMAGSYGGDFAGMAVGDTLQRGKDKIMGGKGQTAFERLGEQQQQRFANDIRNETLMSLGIGPGYLPGVQDQYLAQLGLG